MKINNDKSTEHVFISINYMDIMTLFSCSQLEIDTLLRMLFYTGGFSKFEVCFYWYLGSLCLIYASVSSVVVFPWKPYVKVQSTY